MVIKTAVVGIIVSSLLGLTASTALAAEPVTTCGQVLSDGGFLTADLDCSAYTGGWAVTIERGTLDLAGFTLTGNETEFFPMESTEATVRCLANCDIVGPGVITGGANLGIYAWRRLTLTNVAVVDDGTVIGDGIVAYDDAGNGAVFLFNSTVEGWLGFGVRAERRVVAENTTIRANGSGGILAPDARVLLRNVTVDGGHGVFTNSPAVRARSAKIFDSDISGNFGGGVDSNGRLVLRDSRIADNDDYGIKAGSARIADSDVSGNCLVPSGQGCSDVFSCRSLRTGGSVTCDSSRSCDAENPSWGICSLD
jgi:hypothetical protein